MSFHYNKESNKPKNSTKDSITETLEENVNLLIDPNLIHDLLNHGGKRKDIEILNIEKSIVGHKNEIIDEVNSSSNPKGVLNEMEKHQNSLCDQAMNLSPFCQVLILECKTERQKSKELETDLALAKSALSDVRGELDMLRKRDDQKSKQIDDSNRNVKSIALTCKTNNNALKHDLEISQKQNKDLYNRNNTLENEKKDLKSLLENLNAKITEWKDMELKAATINERYASTLKENKLLSDQIAEMREKLDFFESESFKQMEEIDNLKSIINTIENKLKASSSVNSALEEQVKQLKERHSIVIQKALTSEEEMSKGIIENSHLQSEIKSIQSNKESFRQEIHDFYKRKLHSVLAEATDSMQKRISFLENEIKDKAAAELNKMAEMRKFYEEKTKALNDRLSLRITTLTTKVDSLQDENAELHKQRDAIVRALASRGTVEMTTSNIDRSKENAKMNYNDNRDDNNIRLSKRASYKATSSGRTSSNKESLRRINLEGMKVPPLIASTSISSILPSSNEESIGQQKVISVPSKHRQRRKPKETYSARQDNRRIYTALEIIDSFDSAMSSNKDLSFKNKKLHDIDSEINELEQEISIISGADSCIYMKEYPFEKPQTYNFNR